MKTMILAGGFGTRLAEETDMRPKPMVEIGGRPILWHIMKSYAAHGLQEFAIALGYKGEMVKRYFLDYSHINCDFTVKLGSGDLLRRQRCDDDWTVHLVDTGLHTMTGGRVKRLRHVIGHETFLMTYGDGVSDVNIRSVIEFHKKHGKVATVTAVRPPAKFGALSLGGDRVVEFIEKQQAGEAWINGGFFVLEPAVFDYIVGDETFFEREPLDRLATEGQLMAYQHDGFWQCMDTVRDLKLLESLWSNGKAPWKVWE